MRQVLLGAALTVCASGAWYPRLCHIGAILSSFYGVGQTSSSRCSQRRTRQHVWGVPYRGIRRERGSARAAGWWSQNTEIYANGSML